VQYVLTVNTNPARLMWRALHALLASAHLEVPLLIMTPRPIAMYAL
jgi:hypothetical protein